jgi:DNA polymerase III delta prime subunit
MSTINLFVEKYRPKTIDECILPASLKKTFNDIVEGGECPNLLLSGKAGTGKTSVARALCNQLGADWIIINCSEDGNIDTLRTKIRQFASTISLSDTKKVVILDEFDYSNAQSIQPALRGAIEEFAKNCRFILTCNYKNRIIEPIHSRCTCIDFSIPIKDKKVLSQLIIKHFPDFRRTLNELQRYSSAGTIDVGILSEVGDIKIKELMDHMKGKDFSAARVWVVSNMDNDPQHIFRKLYDGLYEHLKSASIPTAILTLAEYQYKSAFVADQEINLVACVVELMMGCEFK